MKNQKRGMVKLTGSENFEAVKDLLRLLNARGHHGELRTISEIWIDKKLFVPAREVIKDLGRPRKNGNRPMASRAIKPGKAEGNGKRII